MPKGDILSQKSLQNMGQGDYSASISSNRSIFPAIVVPYGTNDNSEQNRIRARIVNVTDDGKIQGRSSSKNEDNYNAYAGKDRGILDEQLVLCMPLLPEFFHVRPQVGEMVFVLMENPSDNASVRYWIGPIISSKLKLKNQEFEDSYKMFNKTDFISNPKTSGSIELSSVFPQDSDVAIQGRGDADLILKNREALLIAGKFDDLQNFVVNTKQPSYLNLKQIDNTAPTTEAAPITKITHTIYAEVTINQSNNKYIGSIVVKEKSSNGELKNETISYNLRKDSLNWLNEKILEAKKNYTNWEFISKTEEYKDAQPNYNSKKIASATAQMATTTANNETLLKKYSQAALVSTNINIYSPRGKFRGDDIKSFEINTDLKSFSKFSDTLHPAIFGDETVRLLDLIIRLLLSHIHTPEMPLVQTSISDELKKYTIDGWLQNLISNHIRIN